MEFNLEIYSIIVSAFLVYFENQTIRGTTIGTSFYFVLSKLYASVNSVVY